MEFAAWYGIIVGLCMFAQWAFFLLAGQVPEARTEPIRLAFHLAGEWSTTLVLMVGRIALMRRLPWGASIYLIGAGMLIYSAIVSPGYFAQQGQWVFVAMFGFLLALALIGSQKVANSLTG